MTGKRFETPDQFNKNNDKREVTPSKLNAPRWFEWDDVKKPINPATVKISMLEARKWAILELTSAGIPDDEAKNNIDFMLSGALNVNYGMLRANMSRQMPSVLAALWPGWVSELIHHTPPQYILGHAPFYGREFIVDQRVLIPRPETEQLVEWILKDAGHSEHPVSVLDIGTGSGAIIETLMLENSRVKGFAADISSEALKVAEMNAQRFNLLNLHFVESDVYSALGDLKFDLIVSNPPYIANDDQAEIDESVMLFEPHMALFADNNGLAIYEKIACGLNEHLADHGRAYFEIGYKQGTAVQELFQTVLPNAKITLRQDFAGLDRMIRVEK
ncbi:release factor glutamine methyltransferase [Leuconostoc litchii]|uniref:Release factor glutamine methyltransferase n=1 Tax=Leuconostoc litchii TaxID=1981069 RepID=A0A652NE79_9LACO|nr:peptide chain release factor N(5)-glutamine methyltransferase [Leuconostoc litchii]TYC46503.1 peptide chain release factor N(5)-glutamine methyltransferase [Leuconostoc litchii]GMA70182.1 release factor glutamine methyltransferase [Leuconostoc litchii]